jgi:hypothetical protein
VVRSQPLRGKFPAILHFAFRHGGDSHKMEWKPFGFVRRERERVTLFNDWAITDEAACDGPDDAVCVKTWFGQGSATFRVASLHPFSLSLVKEPPALPTVRFGFPGEVC